jgi:hypothetical protein
LVDEEVGALVAAVVGDEEARGDGGRSKCILRVEGFEDLSSLR